MKVKLRVLKGSGSGKEVRIPTPKCLIGRHEDCHLRPKSEAISRRHCVIYVKHGKVYVRDLKSRNGTIVNGEKIDSDTELHTGDQVQVGPLHFEVLVDHSLGGEKKPKVKSVKEAAARTTASSRETIEVDESDITDWLDEADELDRARRLTDPETRQLKLDETDQVQLQKAIEESAKKPVDKPAEEEETKEMTEKKKPGKLPKLPDKKTANSRDAAADMLKQFFNNR